MDLLKPAFCLLAFGIVPLLAGCFGSQLGPAHPWVPVSEITGVLHPEVSAPSDPKTASEVLKIVTFNVHLGDEIEKYGEALRIHPDLSQFDLLLVQEIRDYPAEGSSRANRLAAALGVGYVYAPAREVNGGTHGLAILSPHTLQNIRVMELPTADLLVDTERRVALSAELDINGMLVTVVNVHLDTRINSSDRVLQLRPAIINEKPPLIVAGDFNTNPLVWAFNLIPLSPFSAAGASDQADILDDYMRSAGFDTPTASYGQTVDFPLFSPRVDSIYLKDVRSITGGVSRDVTLSDHYPVWLEVGTN